jgi:tRNA-dihydrouridine synthase B
MPIQIGSLSLASRVYVPPMAGVTDLVFREIVRSLDRDCLLATEMISSRGLVLRPDVPIINLAATEHPVGIQLFGHETDVMAEAARIAESRGADLIDINMGCPVPKIVKGGDGCALMRNPVQAQAIVQAVCTAVKIPVTVKFRLGWDENSCNAVEFARQMESAGAAAITLHARTRRQLYAGKADWKYIALVKDAVSIPVFGNGDIFEPQDALSMREITNCDGVAVARGCLGNPWLIPRVTRLLDTLSLDTAPEPVERLVMACRHCLGLVCYKGLRVGSPQARRHLIYYTKGFPGSAPFRARLSRTDTPEQAMTILAELAEELGGRELQAAFLLGIEKHYLEYCKHPGKGAGQTPAGLHAKVGRIALQPVAYPEDAALEGRHNPPHDASHECQD